MSLPRRTMGSIPEETERVARAAFPKGNKYMQMRDELGSMYTDEMFADLYPKDGQPAARPWRLALVTVMQFAENLTDRQTAEAVRDRIAWKYALGLELTDAGFDFSVLSEFRQRLLDHQAEQRLMDEMLEQFRSKGLLKVRGKQRTDSTHIVAAIHQLNQLELIHETLRHALNELAREAPDWLKGWVSRDWFDRYSERANSSLLSKDEQKRRRWAEQVGVDGVRVLEQVYGAHAYPQLAKLQAIEVLRQVWIQNFYQQASEVHLREPANQPPSARQIASPYDTDAHYSSKRTTSWVGYKVHLTETCDSDAPNLITQVETRVSTEPDHVPLEKIQRDLAHKNRLPAEQYVDQGYTSVDHLMNARNLYDIDVIGLIPDDNSWQARLGGYDSTQFAIDWDQQRATCPQGKHSCSWTLALTKSQHPVIKVKFRKTECTACPARALCTHNTKENRRTLTILAPQAYYEAQQTARQRQQTTEFKAQYAVRAGVEGTISQATFALHARRTRYRGIIKVHLQHIAISAAINLLRTLAWLNEVPRSTTSVSQFARLAA